MEAILIIFIFAAAVCYLCRRFLKTVNADSSECGCRGCQGCPAGSRLDEKGSSSGEAINGGLNLSEECSRKTVS